MPLLLERAAQRMGEDRLPAIARMVFTESRAFPDLARVWHDEVLARLLGLVAGNIARGQSRGEVRPGDPNLCAFSITGRWWPPCSSTGLGSETPTAPDLEELAAQHAEIVLRGLATGVTCNRAASDGPGLAACF